VSPVHYCMEWPCPICLVYRPADDVPDRPINERLYRCPICNGSDKQLPEQVANEDDVL